MADDKTNAVPDVSPTGRPVLPQWLVIVLVVLASVAAVIVAIPGMPPVAVAIAGVVSALAAALGVASPGIRAP